MRDTHPVNIETHLKSAAIFSELDDEEVALIAREARELRIDKGGRIFHRGDACTGFHIVVFGQVKLSFLSPRGVEKIVALLEQGQSFGEAMIFLEQPCGVSAEALSNCLLLHIPKSAIFGALGRNRDVTRKLLATLALQTHHLMQDVESYSLLNGRQRIIGYLLDHLAAEERGAETRSLDLAFSKCIIASRLNLTQEHFSRILHELSELGLVTVNGRRLTIPSLERLRAHQFK